MIRRYYNVLTKSTRRKTTTKQSVNRIRNLFLKKQKSWSFFLTIRLLNVLPAVSRLQNSPCLGSYFSEFLLLSQYTRPTIGYFQIISLWCSRFRQIARNVKFPTSKTAKTQNFLSYMNLMLGGAYSKTNFRRTYISRMTGKVFGTLMTAFIRLFFESVGVFL